MFYAADSEQQLTVMISSREDAFLDAGIDRLPDVVMRRVLKGLCTFFMCEERDQDRRTGGACNT